MSGRNRGSLMPIEGIPYGGLPPMHEPPFGQGPSRPMPHPAILEEMREREAQFGHRKLPPHPALLEEQLSGQQQEIQGLLGDNQRLAATHVALKQELKAVQFELQQVANFAGSLHPEKDTQMRDLYEKSVKLEMNLGTAEAMKTELMQVHSDIKDLTMARHELTGQVQMMTQDLTRVATDLQQVPSIKSEIDGLRQELQRTRDAIEYEKKTYAQNYEHGQVLEKNLVSMARELEKLHAEMANAEKRARTSTAVANPGFNANYPQAGYPGNPYPPNYGTHPITMNPVGAENYAQYGPAPGPWGAYDMHRAQGPR